MKTGRKVFIWLALGGSALCCLGVGIPLWTLMNGRDNLDRAVAEYRRTGLPWTSDEVSLAGPASETENAAPVLAKAIHLLGARKVSNEGPKAWSLATAGDDKGSQAIVDKYADVLSIAKEAARKPKLDFHKDWDLGPEVLFPEIAPIRNMSRLLSARAILEARRGEVVASNADLSDAWALGRLVGQEPILIGLLVQISTRSAVFSAAEQSVAAYHAKPEALTALLNQLAKLNDQPEFAGSVRGEAYMGLSILRNGAIFRSRVFHNNGQDDAPPPIDPRLLVRTGAPSGLFERLMGGKILKTYVRLSEIARTDGADYKKLDEDLHAIDRELEADHSINGIYRGMLQPVYSNVGQVFCRDRAQKLTVTALIDAMLMKTTKGRYPTKLAEIPGKWIDPYNDELLHMRVRGDSIRFYSVGPNKKDDGGIAMIEKHGTFSDAYDIVSAYPPPSKTSKP